MCGITGMLDLAGRGRVDPDVLAAMTQVLTHRGPDSMGQFVDGDIGFGFRRLQIIDLESGEQPIQNEDGSMALVCNGEIFNEPDLRQQMEAKGHRFRTRTDVEVLLHLYEEHGVEMIDRINGQFAFAIYDGPRRQLFLARDHFGINPLYFTVVDDLFLFASEIKALLEHPAVPREVDLVGLDQVLCLPGVVSPRTLFKGVESLPSGHLITVQGREVSVREYWDLSYPEEPVEERPESYYVDALEELFARSIERRMRSDVPVGLFVSGGMDSSLIASFAARHRGDDEEQHAFSVTFEDKELDESFYQRLVTRELDMRLHETLIDHTLIERRLREMIAHCECPVKETFNTCILELAEDARAHDITVVLTGQGADELFGGYVGYRLDSLGDRKGQEAFGVDAILEEEMREHLWGDASIFYEKEQVAFKDVRLALVSPTLREDFDDTVDCLRFPPVNKERLRGRHPLHQRSYLDFKLRLADHLLSDHGDRMVMAKGVEARYPFLDIDLVEMVTRIPVDLMVKDLTEKYLLRQVARPHVPAKVLQREKFGFFSPGTPFLLQQGVEWVEDLLSFDYVARLGYFDPHLVERLRKKYSRPGAFVHPHIETDLLMVVLSFHILCEHFSLPALA